MTQSSVEYQRDFADIAKEASIQVLHVDDDASFLKAAEPILEMQGSFRVETASSVEEAMERMKQKEFDAIVCDYVMPEKDGLQFLKELRDSGNSIPFVIFTGKGREEVAIEALNLGADRYFNKIGDPETVYGQLAHGIRQIVKIRQAEDALRDSEGKYRSFVQSFQGIAYRGDKNFEVEFFHGAVNEITGYSEADFVEDKVKWTELIHKDDLPRVLEDVKQVISEKRQFAEREYRIIRKDGKVKWVVEHIQCMFDVSGNVVGSQGTFYDITERKKAEERLRESEERYRGLFESTKDGIIVSDPKGRVLSANPAAATILGYGSLQEFLGVSMMNFYADPEERKTVFEKLVKKGYLRDFEVIGKRRDGKQVVATVSLVLQKDEDGNILRTEGIFRDVTERKMAEKKLRESEERYRLLFEQSPVGIGISTLDGKVIDANEAMQTITGYSLEELRKVSLTDTYEHPKQRRELLESLKQHGAVSGYSVRLKRKDGKIYDALLNISQIRVGDKNLLQTTSQDITERKKVEEALNESERRYRKLFKSTKDGVMVSGPDGKIVSVNSAAAEMLGYEDPEQLLGKPMVQFYKEPKQRKKMFEKLMKKGYLKDFEVSGKRRCGTYFDALVTLTLHKDEDGSILRTEGIFRDVTQRKQVEEAIRESEEKYRSIVELAPDGIITVNTKGIVTSINSAFSRLTGFAEDELVDKHFTKLGTARLRELPRYIRFFSVILRGKTSSPIDFSYNRKDGTLGWAEAQACLMRSRGQTVGVQAIVRDITERKKTDTKLQDVNEKLGVVGELTRHDARNKLSTVKMNTFLMKQKLVDDPESLKHLNEIESACKQVERIFDFAKVYEKIGMEELTYTDVEKTLSEAVMLFPDLQAMKVVNDCKGLTVLGDSLLRQLFYNLIDNSLKHGEKVSRIRLYCKEVSKDQLKLVYEDDGAGIPKAEKKKIFKEGYGKGTGYGLYLISKMCDVYGWTIRETSKQGKGAQFTITIPKLSQDGRENFRFK